MRSFIAATMLCVGIVCAPAHAKAGEVCIASVYSTRDRGQNGTKTASGIPLHDGRPSIAHNALRLRSQALVTHRHSGRSALLPVTDRGPHKRGRCVDLSVAAAILLGCKGLCPVRVEAR